MSVSVNNLFHRILVVTDVLQGHQHTYPFTVEKIGCTLRMGDWYPRMTVFTEQVLVRMALFLEARGTFIRKII